LPVLVLGGASKAAARGHHHDTKARARYDSQGPCEACQCNKDHAGEGHTPCREDDKKQIWDSEQSQRALDKEREFIPADSEWRPPR
jgi:hypothetical protein